MPFGRWFCAVTLTSCLLSLPAYAQTAKASLKDAQGKDVGQVQLTQTPHGVLLKMSLKGAPPGERAFHIHAVGKCEPPFTSAGPHFNPASHKHGMEAKEGSHAGDMPNLHIPASGELVIEIANPMISLVKGSRTRCSTPTARRSSSMPAPTTTRPTPPAMPVTGSPAASLPSRTHSSPAKLGRCPRSGPASAEAKPLRLRAGRRRGHQQQHCCP